MAEIGWSKLFEDPIPIPGGRQLVTLLNAGDISAPCRAKKPKATIGKPRSRRC
jgi:hypothetical protein